jgi:hypothetical protein
VPEAGHSISLALFDLIKQSAAAISKNPAEIEATVQSNTKVLEFCEDFFNQFLKSVAGISISGFDPKDKEEVARARLRKKLAAPVRAVMAQYEKMCDFYFELQGSVHLPGAERRFRVTYMTRLLTRIERWAKSTEDQALVLSVATAAKEYVEAVEGQ